MNKKKLAFLTISVVAMITLLTSALFGQATQRNNVFRHLSIFSEVFDLVRSNYVEPVTSEKLMEGAFSGVTDAIDEFSYYVPPAQMAAYKNFVDVEDNAVGLVVTSRFGYAYVVSAIDGSPAARAGIERGDFIEKIDGRSTQDIAVWQVRNALRQNRPVTLQVLRGSEVERATVKIDPSAFHPLPVDSDTLSGVAYIKIPYFEEGTAAQFAQALAGVRERGTRKLIVDVRGNAAGSVEEAIKAADELLTSGVITSLDGRRIEDKRWQADGATAYDGEVLVLTDSGTASGAEVFASAIAGNKRGRVVGVTTYGKAIVQRFIELPSGGGVHMTVAQYTTPDMKPIGDAGVKPDVTVDLALLAIQSDREEESDAPKDDPILKRALELYGVSVPLDEAA